MPIPNVRSHEHMKHTLLMEKIYKWKRNKLSKSSTKKVKSLKKKVDEEKIEYIPNKELQNLASEKEVYAVDVYMEELQKIEGVY